MRPEYCLGLRLARPLIVNRKSLHGLELATSNLTLILGRALPLFSGPGLIPSLILVSLISQTVRQAQTISINCSHVKAAWPEMTPESIPSGAYMRIPIRYCTPGPVVSVTAMAFSTNPDELSILSGIWE